MASGSNSFPGFPVQLPIGGVEPASTSQPSGYDQVRYGLYSPPDIQSFQISPRRRLYNLSAIVTALASANNTATATVNLPDLLTPNSGWLVDFLGGQVVPQDTAGKLIIEDMNLGLYTSISVVQLLPLGVPTPTTLTPRLGTSLVFPPIPLITAKDLEQWGIATGAIAPVSQLYQNQPQKLSLAVSMTNSDAVNPHSFLVSLWVGIHLVDGLTGA